jgi:hypothetical protein
MRQVLLVLVLVLVLLLVLLLLLVRLCIRHKAAAGETGEVFPARKGSALKQPSTPIALQCLHSDGVCHAEDLQLLLLLLVPPWRLQSHTWAAWPWGQVMQWGTQPCRLLLPLLTAAR